MQKYVFLLGREPLLSLAEIKSLFSHVIQKGSFAIVEAERDMVDSVRDRLGGTIKIGLILEENLTKSTLLPLVIEHIATKSQKGKKLRIGIDSFVPMLSSLVFKAKDALKAQGCSIRVVQHEQGRIKTATTLHEKLLEHGVELMIYPDGSGYTLAETLFVQDIEAYADRDINRDRSMTVGMMPPKLAQIMINLATKGADVIIWDPFCGLGTTLIEGLHSGYVHLIGSDIEPKMVQATEKNIHSQLFYGPSVDLQVVLLDATKVDNYSLQQSTVIVTEGMLGKNFTTDTITHASVMKERKILSELYGGFLDAAYRNPSVESLAFCLPFWNIKNDMLFMPELSALSRHWKIDQLCIHGKRYLVHMRPGQCVGREIVVLRR